MNELGVKDECIAVTLRFFRALDLREHRAAAELMTPDGTWDRQGNVIAGRTAIFAALEKRPADRATAHLVSNIIAAVHDARHATVQFYLTAYEGAIVASAPPGARLGLIRYGTDRFVLGDEGWRIEHKSTLPALVGT